MNNFHQNPETSGIDSAMMRVSQATPLYLFFACIASFIILLVVQTVHDMELWSTKMPTIGIFLGIAGPLFIQAVRFGGLLGSTFNFSRKQHLAGILCITLSVSTSLWEHSHVPAIAAFFITEANSWAELNTLTSFLQILIWIGLGLELLIVVSTYGKMTANHVAKNDPLEEERAFFRTTFSDFKEDLERLKSAAAELKTEKPMDLDPLLNGNGAKH